MEGIFIKSRHFIYSIQWLLAQLALHRILQENSNISATE